MSDPDVLTAALDYVGRGWYIFPVVGKLPRLDLVPHWSQDSTVDPERIVSWFAGTSGLGIGLDLGRSGLCVVDGDHLEHLHFRGQLDGWTYRGNPARQSWLFSVNGHPIPQARHAWGEVKSSGGYVVLPPSPWPGAPDARYEWLGEHEGDPPTLPADVEVLIAPKVKERSDPSAQAWDGAEADPAQIQQASSLMADQAKRCARATQDRNILLNEVALILGHYVPHYLSKKAVVDALLWACERNGLLAGDGQSQCMASIRSGLTAGMAEPRQLPTKKNFFVDDASSVDVEDVVFEYTELLAVVRRAARARLVSPWAVLGSVLALILAETPPHYVIPPMVGTAASLNFALALTGPTGTGKSSAFKVALELLGAGLRARRIGPGSGEGLLAAYLRWDTSEKRNVLRDDRQCVLYADEVGQVGALKERAGTTHPSLLRSALTGDDLSTTNADPSRNRHIPAGQYRLAMIIGVQPALAGVLLDDTEEGGPQRLLWLPSQDRNIPDQVDTWPEQVPIRWQLPASRAHADLSGRVLLTYPAHVAEQATAGVRARHREGLDHTDPDSHALLTRMKVAAGVALLHGRLDVSDADWAWSDLIMRVSAGMRSGCEQIAVSRAGRELEGKVKARRRAENAAAGDEARDDATAIHRLVVRHAEGGVPARHKAAEYSGCPKGCITGGLRALRAQGDRLVSAMEYGESAGWLVTDDQGRLRPGPRTPEGG